MQHLIPPGVRPAGRECEPNTLRLSMNGNGSPCVRPGDTVTVVLAQECLSRPMQGYFAYLIFDPTRLTFVEGAYTPTPYGLPAFTPIEPYGPSGEYLQLGAAVTSDQSPTQEDADLVTLTFTAAQEEGPATVAFRFPPPWTRFYDPEFQNYSAYLEYTQIYIDATPPEVTCPPTLVISCLVDLPPAATTTAEFEAQGGTFYDAGSSYCGDPTFTLENETSNGGSGCAGDPLVIERTYGVTDGAGNYASCTQLITIEDNTAPTFDTFPEDVIVECPAEPGETGTPTASDDCGTPTLTYSDEIIPGCGNTGTIHRTWRAEDACGNFVERVQQIIVQDTTDPQWDDFPPDRTIECGSATDPSATGTPTGHDTCGDVTITYSDDVEPGCGLTGIITRTWHIEDECENVAERDQIIVIRDTTTPQWDDFPPDRTVECGSPTSPWATGTATGHDTCGDVTITYSDDVEPGCGLTGIITRTWHIEDECGLFREQDQVITVEDTTAPTFTSFPEDVLVECPNEPGDTGAPTGRDGCGDVTITHVDETVQGCGDTYTTTRTWRVTDDCGNFTERAQLIGVSDTTPPTFTSFPPDAVVQCPDEPGDTGTPTGADTCGDVTITHSDEIEPGCGGTYVITRTWRVTDECDLECTQVQLIGVIDTIGPQVDDPPADTTVECDAIPDAPATLPASDACDPEVQAATYDGQSITPGSCPDEYTITRTWTATDACDNTTTVTQLINVQDTTPPILGTCPPLSADNDTGLCGAVLTLAVTATDNCTADPEVLYAIESEPGSGVFDEPITNPYEFPVGETTVQAVARDACQLESDPQTFLVTISDVEAPLIEGCPQDIVRGPDPGEMGAIITWTEPNATDNCGVTVWESTHSPGDFFEMGTNTVTYTAGDAAGNTTICTFDVVIVDLSALEVTIEMQVNIPTEGMLDRCLLFELWNCDMPELPPVEYEAMLTFVDSGDGSHTVGLAHAVLTDIPAGDYTCITARDPLHTVRRTLSAPDFGLQDGMYRADFVTADKLLISGNANGDCVIDVRDYGVFVCLSGTHFDSNGDGVDDGNTPCGMWDPHAAPPRFHADFSGNGVVWQEDFTYFRNNFLALCEPDCCLLGAFGGDQPILAISLAELRATGQGEFAAADLNGDGWLDVQDIEAFEQALQTPTESATTPAARP
ncbi:MAG: HYR domain-containing protein [Phycisphaerae bacterium]